MLKGLLGATLFFLLANLATDMVYGPRAARPPAAASAAKVRVADPNEFEREACRGVNLAGNQQQDGEHANHSGIAGVSVRSLIATSSSPQSGRSRMARASITTSFTCVSSAGRCTGRGHIISTCSTSSRASPTCAIRTSVPAAAAFRASGR